MVTNNIGKEMHMARQLRNYNYKDKNVIISLFNESQSYYKKYKECN